jgi:hypothetical protein
MKVLQYSWFNNRANFAKFLEGKKSLTRLTLPLFLGEKHALTATTAGLTTLTTPAELQKTN